ncbi:MAG: HEAT repeat domain-containing protein [Gemmatales bacterium]
MTRNLTYMLITLFSLAVVLAAPQDSFAQARTALHPSYQPHYGCFGYCNGPLRPNTRPSYYGCFGYCPGPLYPQPHPHYGCFGYCPYPITPVAPFYYFPTYNYLPDQTSSSTTYNGNLNYVPQTPSGPPKSPEDKVNGKNLYEWMNELKSPNSRVRGDAVAAIGLYGPVAREAIQPLIAVFKDANAAVRVEATVTLAMIGDPAISPLIDVLQRNDDPLRMGAALTLGHLGTKAIAAVPALTSLLKDKNEALRSHAAQALCALIDRLMSHYLY